MTIRRKGWYWVKFSSGGKWSCLFYNGKVWEYNDEPLYDWRFNIIGPRIPTPDESWQ